MKEHTIERLPPITPDMLPQTIEQRMLTVLESIDAKLMTLVSIAMTLPALEPVEATTLVDEAPAEPTGRAERRAKHHRR